MSRMELLCLALAGAAAFSALLCIWAYRRRTERILNAVSEMLDAAMNGSFTEQTFDETKLSALEARLGRYLSASELSARRVAKEKDKIKELIADISHQTKTPVSNILLYGELLRERELTQESWECVQAINNQAEKLRFLITSLVRLSRLETGILSLHPSAGPVMPLLTELERQYEGRAAEKGVKLFVEPSQEQAEFDGKWTLEAIGNIVDNAIKYTPSGGFVRVRVTGYEMFCCIEVADTGIGIPEEEQARIFSRFYRSSAVSQEEGVGIGLYLARQILLQEGGYVKVRSIPGEGAVFFVYLSKCK